MSSLRIQSYPLLLVAATPEMLRADLAGDGSLGRMLQAETPADWPPGEYDAEAIRFFLEKTEASGEDGTGWYCWYALTEEEGVRRLVGSGGFLGAPDEHGAVETGYSIAEAERGQGYGTELVSMLVGFALTHDARKIVAHTDRKNAASIAVLENNGFEKKSLSIDGKVEYVLTA